jgi:hypothetical protein
LVSVRQSSRSFGRMLTSCFTIRVLRAAYKNEEVQKKLQALNPDYPETIEQSVPNGNMLKVKAIMHMMTGIEPQFFGDHETFRSSLDNEAKSTDIDPLEYSPTIVFIDGHPSVYGSLRPIRYYKPPAELEVVEPPKYTLLIYGNGGTGGQLMPIDRLADEFVWATRLSFELACADKKTPLLSSSTRPKLDTKGYFVLV